MRLGIVLLLLLASAVVEAGMPAPLPTPWTPDNPVHSARPADQAVLLRWQSISFFLMVLLLTTLAFRALWNSLASATSGESAGPNVPKLSIGGASSLVLLWGLLFIVVLTMISGARELMTPGAWEKTGWTYRLRDSDLAVDNFTERRDALEELRFTLWNFAANHDGRFPDRDDPAIPPSLWRVPHVAGAEFLYRQDESLSSIRRILACEPETDSSDRFVLLTDGSIAVMSSTEIAAVWQSAIDPIGEP